MPSWHAVTSVQWSNNGWELPNSLYVNDEPSGSVEHVLPQKPGEDWRQFTDDEAAASYRRIGNLALLEARHNSGLKSATFEEKRQIYAQAPYPLTAQIAEFEKWSKVEINQRQKALADLAVKTWPLSAD